MSTSTQTINDVLPKTQITATNLQTVFDADWTADVATDVLVYARATGVDPDDATQIISSANYSVTFVGSSLTVRVTFSVGRTTDDIVTLVRDTPANRENLYTNTNFTPTMLNQDFGVHTLVEQQAQLYNEEIAPHYNVSATIQDFDLILPILPALSGWRMNSAGDEIEAVSIPDGGFAPADATYLVQTADSDLANAQAMGALASGLVVNTTTTGVQLTRTLTGTTDQIDVSNGDGISGAPTLTIASNAVLPGTGSMIPPSGTTGQRPGAPLDGMVRYNTTLNALEVYESSAWDPLSGGVVDTVTGTASEIDVDNTDPANPIIELPVAVIFPGTAAFLDGTGILTGNGNNALLFNQTATAVNYLEITPAATANGPLLQAVGTDANVDFLIQAKGTGDILFNGSDVICGDPGAEGSGIDIGGVTYDSALKVSDLGGTNVAQFIVHRHSTTLQPLIVGARSNSDTSAHTAVTAGQSCFTTYGAGWTGAEYNLFGAVDIMVDSTGTINDASSPGQIQFNVTLDSATVPSTAVTISNDKTVTFAGDLDASMTNGQLLIGDTGNVLAKSTLTAGTGISITNAAGSITINSTATGMAWTTDASGTIAADVDNGYVCGNAGATTITLPATAAIGSNIEVEGLTSTSWILTANAGQTIQIGTSVTSTAGTLTSAAVTDNVEVVCIVADTTWRVQRTNSAGLTIA